MTTNPPEQSAPPRRDIAGTTARALRAARGTTPPPAEPDPQPADIDEPVTDEPVPTNDAVPTNDTVTDDAATDAVPTDDAVTDDAVTDAVTDAVPTDDTVTDEPIADAPRPVELADDEPPVLAGKRPRDTARTPGRPGRPGRAVASPARRQPRRITVISAGVAAAALVFAVISGVVWWHADHAATRTVATARDDVAVDARIAIATVNTSDYRKPAAALSNWIAVSTGSLKSQFTDQRKSATTLLGQSKMITSATVLDAAVTKLNTTKGSATVIASVNLKRKPATGAATTTRNRFRATLTRQGGDWKLADLALVAVQLT